MSYDDEYALRWSERIERSPWMSTKDKELFVKFAEDAKLHDAKEKRIEKYRIDLCMAHSITGKDILGMMGSQALLEDAVKRINAANNYSPASKQNSKRTLGSLFCFKHFKDRSLRYAPRAIKEMVSHRFKASDKRVAKEIITREDMRELLNFGNTLDKAIISTLFDSGMRIGEFVQITKADLTFTDEGVDIKVPAGKTGERRITVVEAKTYLARWLEEHPDKSPNALLWISPYTLREFGARGIEKRIQETVKRVNLFRKKKGLPLFAKPANPHNFRHSCASELGGEQGMTEQIMCKFFGWEIASDMPKTYIHLTDAQVRRAVLAAHGKAKDEEHKKIETHRICSMCKAENPLGKNYCGQCGQPVDSSKQITRIGQLEEHVKKQDADIEALLGIVNEQIKKGNIKTTKGTLTEKQTHTEIGK